VGVGFGFVSVLCGLRTVFVLIQVDRRSTRRSCFQKPIKKTNEEEMSESGGPPTPPLTCHVHTPPPQVWHVVQHTLDQLQQVLDGLLIVRPVLILVRFDDQMVMGDDVSCVRLVELPGEAD